MAEGAKEATQDDTRDFDGISHHPIELSEEFLFRECLCLAPSLAQRLSKELRGKNGIRKVSGPTLNHGQQFRSWVVIKIKISRGLATGEGKEGILGTGRRGSKLPHDIQIQGT